LPKWQVERAQCLHGIFFRIKAQVQRGARLHKLARRRAAYHNARPFKSAPDRRLALTPGTLLRLYRAWLRAGEIPSALYLRYGMRRSSIPAPVLCRLVDFSAQCRWPDMQTAWRAFQKRHGSFGRGRRSRMRRLPISYGQLCYFFSGRQFQALQTRLLAITEAQTELNRLRLQIQATIRRRLPDRPSRPRKGLNFQI